MAQNQKKQLLISFSLLSFGILLFAFAANAQTNSVVATETPWGWYVSRSSAFLGFLMLYLSIFLGLTIRIPWLRKLFSPVYSVQAHTWISVQALLLALVHGVALLFDKFLTFSLKDVFIPFYSSYETNLVALGTIGFYLMLLIITTSYGRKYISQSVWRMTHSLNIGLYIIVFIHALYLGTDLKYGALRAIFIWANALLVILFIYNIFMRTMFSKQIK